MHHASGSDAGRCLILYGSPSSDLQNDVIEYWFGAFLTNHFAGFDDDGKNLDVIGINTPFTGSTMSFNGGDSADHQFFDDAAFITTSGILDPATYPQFESWVAAKYDRPGGPFDPHNGTRYAYSQIADQTFKRLTHTVNVPAGEQVCRSGPPTTRSSTGITCSSRLTLWARMTGRPSKT